MKIFSKHRFHVTLKKLGVEKVFTEDAELDHLGVQATDMYASYQAVGFEVKIPEMKIFSKHRFHVALKKLGVEKVFTEDAELDHLGVQATDMYASYQAVGFEVNEHLVRGGATGTAGLQSLSGIVGPPMEKEEKVHNEEYEVTDEVTKRFVADRPFFFALVRDDLILYAGHYM
ncbi:hypothetical protein AB6A40_008062 [Gnathostoma spinigerum]|uniref:Serpin domain-containing protein n=1 Tax=Gnathostoma spinigerum TaxID=75299 RepID=A0ABD6EN22_9BILA